MRARAVLLAVALALAPLGARAADLVVWWEKGFYPQEDEAVAEIIAAFEQKTGKQVELVQYEQDEHHEARRKRPSGGGAARLPVQQHDRDEGLPGGRTRTGWSISRASSPRSWTCSMPMPSTASTLLDGKTGRRGLYALPMGRYPITSMPGRASWSGPGSPSPTFPRSGRRSGRSGATGCSRRCARPWAGTTSGASACRCRPRRPTPRSSPVSSPTRRSVTPDRRLSSTIPQPGRNDQGDGPPTRDLAQGLHAARLGDLGRPRQQQGVPYPGGRDDAERGRFRSRRPSRAPGPTTTTGTPPQSIGPRRQR